MPDLLTIITATDLAQRNRSLEAACASLSAEQLNHQTSALDAFCRQSENLYERGRALFFLYAIHRFHLPDKLLQEPRRSTPTNRSRIPFKGYEHLLHRRFE